MNQLFTVAKAKLSPSIRLSMRSLHAAFVLCMPDAPYPC